MFGGFNYALFGMTVASLLARKLARVVAVLYRVARARDCVCLSRVYPILAAAAFVELGGGRTIGKKLCLPSPMRGEAPPIFLP